MDLTTALESPAVVVERSAGLLSQSCHTEARAPNRRRAIRVGAPGSVDDVETTTQTLSTRITDSNGNSPEHSECYKRATRVTYRRTN